MAKSIGYIEVIQGNGSRVDTNGDKKSLGDGTKPFSNDKLCFPNEY